MMNQTLNSANRSNHSPLSPRRGGRGGERLLLFSLLLLFPFIASAQKLAPNSPGNVFVTPGTEAQDITLNVTNWGSEDVTSFAYTLYYFDTQVTEAEKTVTLASALPNGESTPVTIPITPGEKPGSTDVIINITKVNGTYNQTSVTTAYITRLTVRTKPVKRVVVEEWTGMWCQYCTKGLVIMQVLKRLYGDRFIGVAVHDGDKLATSAYDGMKSTYGQSFPSLWVARKSKSVDVLDYSVFENELKVPALANIDVQARWDAARNAVTATAHVEPVVDVTTKYAIAYVLTADGLQHSSFTQKNNYDWYGMEGLPPEADPFTSGDDISGQNYDEVAIASFGIKSGVDGSLTTPLEANVAQTHSVTFDNISQYAIVNNYSTLKDRSNLHVVALLIDTQTNQVVNAAQCDIDAYAETFDISFEKTPWITLHNDRAYRLPEGVKAYQVSETGALVTVSDGTQTDLCIAAGSSLLLHAEQGSTFTATYVSETGVKPEGCLKGSLFDTTTEGSDEDYYFYKLSRNASGEHLGFYWGAADGAPFTSKAGRCYLVLPKSQVTSSNMRGFALDDEGQSTGICGAVPAAAVPTDGNTYDLSGRRVAAPTAPGTYVVGGKKVIK